MKDIIGLVIVGILFYSCLFTYSIQKGKIDCRNQATSMGFGYDFEWYIFGTNVCTYILPDGKRVISSKYRVLD